MFLFKIYKLCRHIQLHTSAFLPTCAHLHLHIHTHTHSFNILMYENCIFSLYLHCCVENHVFVCFWISNSSLCLVTRWKILWELNCNTKSQLHFTGVGRGVYLQLWYICEILKIPKRITKVKWSQFYSNFLISTLCTRNPYLNKTKNIPTSRAG